MNTNTIKCELCREFEDDEYYLDNFRVCRNCYEESKENKPTNEFKQEENKKHEENIRHLSR